MVQPPPCVKEDGVFDTKGSALKLSGWIFMIISWGFIFSLLVFCYSRIFRQGIDGEKARALKRIRK